MRVLALDNHDSFTFKLLRRNDAVSPGEILELQPDRIAVSSGPRISKKAGVPPRLFEKAPAEGGRGPSKSLSEL